jgi:hypothetical protein
MEHQSLEESPHFSVRAFLFGVVGEEIFRAEKRQTC